MMCCTYLYSMRILGIFTRPYYRIDVYKHVKIK